jgi:hypothetical protein
MDTNWAQPGFQVYEDMIFHCVDGPIATSSVLFAVLSPSLADILLGDSTADILEMSLPDHKTSELLHLLQVGYILCYFCNKSNASFT